MTVLVKYNVVRTTPIYLSDKYKSVCIDDEALLDRIYQKVSDIVEALKADDEYIKDITAIIDANTNKVLFEF